MREKFTQKERDNETGLDYFGARYYANIQGRFGSPDPIHFQKMMLIDPQRFNLYAYVRNNPLKLIDPSGMIAHISVNGNPDEVMSGSEISRGILRTVCLLIRLKIKKARFCTTT